MVLPDTALDRAASWTRRRTLPPAGAVAPGPERVSVVLPARDEEATVGDIVQALLDGPVATGHVHEVLVVDSHSQDATAKVAAEAGARVVEAAGPVVAGKGDALLTGVREMTGGLGVFLDADVVGFRPSVAVDLVTPLQRDPALVLVKGYYDRPWDGPGEQVSGGRVTELVARPLLGERAPELAGLAQPLAGEAAFRRSALLDVDFVSGYGVDIGHVLAVHARHGLDALAQVDLGERRHRHQDLAALGRMALQVRAAFGLVLDGLERVDAEHAVPLGAEPGLTLHREVVSTWRLGSPTGLTSVRRRPHRSGS